jgi:cell division protein FtsB
MPTSESGDSTSWFRWGIGAVLTGALVWVLFFDSHSLLRRYYWQQELESLNRENARLQSKIDRLQEKLDRPLPDSVVERIARNEYGMKRPGETIYRVKPEQSSSASE